MNSFSAFGLSWRDTATIAEIGLPGVQEGPLRDEGEVVVIEDGDILPTDVELEPGLHSAAEGCWLLGVPGIAGYRITPGRITVDALVGADSRAVQVFLMGSAMGTVLHLRGILPLHGSTVRKPDGTAAVFCGHSGAGKSTIVTALGQRGFPCVADDVSAVHFDDEGRAWVYPGLPRVKLWGHALAQLGIAQGQQIRPGMDKYYVDLPAHQEPLLLTSLFELAVKEDGSVTRQSIQGMQRVSTLLTHTYRPSFVTTLGLQAAHMAHVARLASQLDMNRIARPRGKATLSDIGDLVAGMWA